MTPTTGPTSAWCRRAIGGGTVSARVEIDVETAGKVRRRTKVVQDGEDLEQATSRGVYRDCRIGEIRVEKGNEFVELRVPGGECYLRLGEAWGDVDALAVQRQMIRRTIREHLDKEKRLRPQGIKVLSLFFIIGRSGVEATETAGAATTLLDETAVELPDVLTELQDRTQLTRRSIRRILCESGRLDDFKRNPQRFIELAAEAINRCKRSALVDGIKYQRLGDDDHYAQELFESEELTGYLKNMLSETKKSVYEQVVFDSGIEAAFAEQLEKNPRRQGIRQAARLVHGADAPRQLQPGLGRPDRLRGGRTAVPRGRDEGQPVRRRSSRHRRRQDQVREGAFRRPRSGGAGRPVRGGKKPRRSVRGHRLRLIPGAVHHRDPPQANGSTMVRPAMRRPVWRSSVNRVSHPASSAEATIKES